MNENDHKHAVILGTRGIPATHGGFETFAEELSKYLAERNWKVTVYCQESGRGASYRTHWLGIERVHIPVGSSGSLGSVFFDFKAVLHSLGTNAVFLTLGYNTAIFNVLHRLRGRSNVINMDGIEWKRGKWGAAAKAWFMLNEWLGCRMGNHLVADNPGIADHLARRVTAKKISMIPYGAHEVLAAQEIILEQFGIHKNNYALVVARTEPENSILELVEAFSERQRGAKLVVLGNLEPDSNAYHEKIMTRASSEVLFPGAIYDSESLASLRFFARFYVHGHQVGGTNPSLVEALGAGSAIVAHDNVFNRWVAKDAALYFSSVESASNIFDQLLNDNEKLETLRVAAQSNFEENFRWEDILSQYETLLTDYLPAGS